MRRTIGGNARDRRRARRAAARRQNGTHELTHDDVREIEELVAAASGSTSLPLSDRNAAWDAGAAAKSLDDADFAKAYFWKDPEGDATAKSSYKLPFASKAGGTLTAIWRGVTAAAGALSGARGGVSIPEVDVAGVKSKVASYYSKAATKYGDDNIKPPWTASEGQSAAFLLAYAECASLDLDRLYADGEDGEEILVGVGGGDGMDEFLARRAYWEDELGGTPNQGTKPDKRLKENKTKAKDDANPEESALAAIDEYQAAVRCACGHPFAEHSGAGGTCGHEDGRGTCRCGEFSYPEVDVAALAQALVSVRPDLAGHEDQVMRIAERMLLSVDAASDELAWDANGFTSLLRDITDALATGDAVDVAVALDKVAVRVGDEFYVAPLAIDAVGDPLVGDRSDWHLVTDDEFVNGWTNFAPTIETPEAAEVLPESSDEVTPAPAAAADGGEIPWHSTFLPEGKLTEDGRSFAPGSVILPPDEQARQLPLTLMAMIETSAEGGHDGAKVAGRIDDLYRTAPLIEADGVFSKEDYGQMIARMVESGELTGLSVDIAPLEYEWVPKAGWFDEAGDWIAVQNSDTGEWGPADGFDDDRDAEITSIEEWIEAAENRVLVITKAVIGMATVCPFPAFGDASIALTAGGIYVALTAAGMPYKVILPLQFEIDRDALVAAGLAPITAAAAGLTPMKPPAEWFADPELAELTPMTITDEGRIFGHAWQWETCHLSFDQCIVAPHSETNYAYFMLGEIECADGERLPVGKVTLGTPHAGTRLTRQQATAHYDNTGTVAAYVQFGEDEHGGWFAGAIAPGLSEEKVVALRGSTPSGDWRGVDGNLELVAILAVNVPGFPVPRGLVAAINDVPVPVSLVAAGVVTDARVEALKRQIGEALAGGHLVPAALTEQINDEVRQVFEDAGFETPEA